MSLVPIDEIRTARERIARFAIHTPLVPAPHIDVPDGNTLWLKAENFQRTGSFKFRGAANAIACLDQDSRSRGVITYSSGNHGQAVACAAHLAGVRAVVVMPEDAISVKVEATRQWGAEVVFAGYTSLERHERALELAEQYGYRVIPPFDDPHIIAGQGTAGLEIIEQLPEVEVVLVPVGGGGLISGIATAIKATSPRVQVIGVEPEGGADARDSLHSESPVTWNSITTIADGLRTSRIGDLNYQAMRETVDDIVTVSDKEILRTVQILAIKGKLVTEPSGATAPAAAVFGKTGVRHCRIVAVVSGGNIAPDRLANYVQMVAEEVEASRSP